MRLLMLVVLAAALAAPGRAQLFPFSNLHSYFKSVSAGGPGAGADADADAEETGAAPEAGEARAAVVGAEPSAAAAEPVPSQELRPPANHRLHEADAQPAEAAPVVGLLRPASYPSQEASESGFAGVTAGLGLGHGHGGNDRVEFQMHGQHGPHSYKWGYDTGKGHNRQFRYEERDAHGHVKGHYGFYDKHGKLQVVSYSADPEHGYHADGNFGKHSIA